MTLTEVLVVVVAGVAIAASVSWLVVAAAAHHVRRTKPRGSDRRTRQEHHAE